MSTSAEKPAPRTAPRPEAVAEVGFIGLGLIGLPMAARLAGAGFRVLGFDASAERHGPASAAGVDVRTDLRTLSGLGQVFVVVATEAQLTSVLDAPPYSDNGMSGSALVVMSTIGPAGMARVVERAALIGVVLIDCPVTGGVSRAADGELTLFAAGDPVAVERYLPLLNPLGTVIRCGDRPGDGQALKMVNNMLATTHLVATAQALSFARRLGLDTEVVLDALPRGTAASWILSDRGERMVAPRSARENAVTYLEILAKDARLVAASAAELEFTAPLADVVSAEWDRAVALGLGRFDDSAIVDIFD